LFSLIAVRARGAIKFNKTFFSPFFAVWWWSFKFLMRS
jgi:hypothetical protein